MRKYRIEVLFPTSLTLALSVNVGPFFSRFGARWWRRHQFRPLMREVFWQELGADPGQIRFAPKKYVGWQMMYRDLDVHSPKVILAYIDSEEFRNKLNELSGQISTPLPSENRLKPDQFMSKTG